MFPTHKGVEGNGVSHPMKRQYSKSSLTMGVNRYIITYLLLKVENNMDSTTDKEYAGGNPLGPYDYGGDKGTGMIVPQRYGDVDKQEMETAIDTAVKKLVGTAPETLDTLGELADAISSGGATEALIELINTKANTDSVYTKAEIDANTVTKSEYDTDKTAFALRDELPTKLSELDNDTGFITSTALADYTTNTAFTQAVDELDDDIADKVDLSTYENDKATFALKSDIPVIPENVSDFVNDAGYITADSISGKLDKTEAAQSYLPKGNYATVTYVDSTFQPKGDYLTEHQDISGKLDKSEAEQLYQPKGNYATVTYVEDTFQIKGDYATVEYADDTFQPKGDYLTEHQDLSDYATKSEVTDEIASKIAEVVANAPEDFDTLKEVANYISSDKTRAVEMENAISENATAIATKVDKSEVDSAIAEKDAVITALNTELYNLKKIVGGIGGNVTYEYPGIDGKSVGTLMANNGTVKLMDNVEMTTNVAGTVSASNHVTLSLNNKTMSFSGSRVQSYGCFLVRGKQELTVSGNGTLKNDEEMAIAKSELI